METLSTILAGMSGPPGQGYPPSYPPAQRPGGGGGPHEGYAGPPVAPGYNNYPGHGGPPPPGWNSHPPTSGNDAYNRGYPAYPQRPGPYPGPGPQPGPTPPTSSSPGTPPPPVSQPYDQYQVWSPEGLINPLCVCRIFCSSCLIINALRFFSQLLECI